MIKRNHVEYLISRDVFRSLKDYLEGKDFVVSLDGMPAIYDTRETDGEEKPKECCSGSEGIDEGPITIQVTSRRLEEAIESYIGLDWMTLFALGGD